MSCVNLRKAIIKSMTNGRKLKCSKLQESVIKQLLIKICHIAPNGKHLKHAPIHPAQLPEATISKAQFGSCHRKLIINYLLAILGALSFIISAQFTRLTASAYKSGIGLGGSGGSSSSTGERMVRLCIASVDPIKLTSQCVMCNRREFPLTVIDCTGITKVNDLIANPLSVQEATCLIYNCRRQVPDVKPEPYHGSVSHAVNYRGSAAASNYHSTGMGGPALGSNIYEMMTPSGIFDSGYPIYPPSSGMQSHQTSSTSPYMTRFGSSMVANGGGSPYQASPYSLPYSASAVPRGLIGGPSLSHDRQQSPLPYALVPAPRTFPFGSRRYKAALVPLFK